MRDRGKNVLHVPIVAGRARFGALQIDTKRRARGAGAGQAEHRAAATVKEDAHALMLCDRAIDRVVIFEIISRLDTETAGLGSAKMWQALDAEIAGTSFTNVRAGSGPRIPAGPPARSARA